MPPPSSPTDDPLEDFQARRMALAGEVRTVYVAGDGPAVVVMSEMPGISPEVARFARWVRDAGFTAWMPSLFGRDGAVPQAQEGVEVFKRACVSAQFRGILQGTRTPAVDGLRALARLAHAECGGRGVGAVGMCFTGSFAISLMLEGCVLAPVACQPSMPLDDAASPGLPAADLAVIRRRLEEEDLTVRGYRFEGDTWCRAERFAAYERAFGARFIGRVLPDSAANPDPPPFFKQVVASPHSVVTAHLVDGQGQPTRQARDEILAFLAERLLPPKDETA